MEKRKLLETKLGVSCMGNMHHSPKTNSQPLIPIKFNANSMPSDFEMFTFILSFFGGWGLGDTPSYFQGLLCALCSRITSVIFF